MQDQVMQPEIATGTAAGAQGDQGARPHPVRGGTVLHRGAGLARGRRRQGGGAQSRRAGALGIERSPRRQFALFHLLQPQQAQRDLQPQERGGQGAAAADDRQGRCPDREHGAGHLRPPGLRLSAAERDQSAIDLRPGQGLRAGEPARELSVLRHDRPGDGRHDGRERPSRPAAGPAGPDHRRYRHRHASALVFSSRE